ncbi:formyltransferase family protein [Agarivorans sp. DSG3-1]|uniref:formyltransferase family protein n=1 Tax=Agarivorans sp. DSG3-1 TaxID=3342249 RepID=UPI00398E56D1
MRAGFIGCVDSSRAALKTLLGIKGLTVSAVVTRQQSAVNADFCDLTDLCNNHEIPFHLEDPQARDVSVDFLEGFELDVIFCIGWSYLLDAQMLALPKQGVIGFHPACLPSNRGRHPIIWALALGLKETASTFFLMDEGADSGPVVNQILVPIDDSDNATSLYDKILQVSQIQLSQLGSDLVTGTLISIAQDHSQATYWRKRSRSDGTLDFRMSATSIHNLVRALASPYPGAEFIFNDKYICVKSSRISSEDYLPNIEPGKVLLKKGYDLLVKTSGSEAVWLLGLEENDIAIGEYL